MKTTTLFRHKTNLFYDLCASLRRLVVLIASKTGNNTIDLGLYADSEVCNRVSTWIADSYGESAVRGLYSSIRLLKGEDFRIVAEDEVSITEEYELAQVPLDELFYLHAEVEKIYKFVSKNGTAGTNLDTI